jgi:FMN phosphatase YigB (HAD superfamily)
MRTPKFFYFDLGNVLLHFDHSLSARQIAELAGCPYEVAWEAVFGQYDLEGQYESGQLNGESFHRRFCEITGTSPPLNEFLHAASAIFWPVWGSVPLVAQLSNAGYRLGILSNTCDGHWDYCQRNYPFLTWYFPVVCLSFEAAVMKPAPAIYQYACEKVGLKPSEVFFVDDREDNVAGAKAAGMDAVRFTTPHQLARDLYERGVRMNF